MTTPIPAGALATEPVAVTLAGLVAVIDAGIVLAQAFGWITTTNGQTAAVIACISAVTAATGAVLRSRVWSPASVAQLTTGGGL